MILNKFFKSNTTVTWETFCCTLEFGEHLKETRSYYISRSNSLDHIWVSSWVEFVFNFLQLKSTITIGIKFSKCLLD